MRILFLNKASLRHEGGAEIRTREVGKRLVSAGHEVVVLAAKTNIHDPPFEMLDPSTRPPSTDSLRVNGIRLYHKKVLPDWLVKRFPAPRYLPLAAANFFLMFHLRFFLKKEKFDVIREDISPFPPSFLLAFVRLKVPKRIAVVHNLPGTLQGWLKSYGLLYGVAGFLFDRLLRKGWLKYDRIICVAEWLAVELKNFPKIAEKVVYVPNGVDLERFSRIPPPLRGGGWGEGAIRLLSVGRLVELKGHSCLIEALALLKEEYPQVKLTLLGDGPLKNSLTRLAVKLGIGDCVEILPPVPYEEMPRVYREFDFLVFPSVSEGFPMVILEAMASRLPIVASDIPAVRGILDENTATLTASRNPADLAEKLKRAFEHPDVIDQKTAAAYSTVKRYDWNIIAGQEVKSED